MKMALLKIEFYTGSGKMTKTIECLDFIKVAEVYFPANIQVNDVPYYGIDENNIAYIRITRFSRNTAKDFKNALIELILKLSEETKLPIWICGGDAPIILNELKSTDIDINHYLNYQ